VSVSISPGSINATSNGNWISVRIETGDWAASRIVLSSLSLDGIAPAIDAGATVSGNALTVKFQRDAFASRPDGDYLLTLTGQRDDGAPFMGTAWLGVHGSNNGINKRGARRQELRVVHTTASHATIAFSLDQPSAVSMDVLDLQGRVVAHLERGTLPAGDYQRTWPALGQSVPSGIYLVHLRTTESRSVVRLAVMR
jgi:hypothetical protein